MLSWVRVCLCIRVICYVCCCLLAIILPLLRRQREMFIFLRLNFLKFIKIRLKFKLISTNITLPPQNAGIKQQQQQLQQQTKAPRIYNKKIVKEPPTTHFTKCWKLSRKSRLIKYLFIDWYKGVVNKIIFNKMIGKYFLFF